MKFPFEYGDSITSSFEGNGTYCGDHLIKNYWKRIYTR